MKKIIAPAVLLGFLLTQDKSGVVLEEVFEVEHLDSLYACLLTDKQKITRMEEIQHKIISKVTQVDELTNGYLLSFNNDEKYRKEIERGILQGKILPNCIIIPNKLFFPLGI